MSLTETKAIDKMAHAISVLTKKAFLAGFRSSYDGWNGAFMVDHPPVDKVSDDELLEVLESEFDKFCEQGIVALKEALDG